jgi:hypothetical protein
MSGPASASTPVPVPTVGIRLLDAPTSLANDPRAREYIIDHVAQGTTISRQVEITNTTAVTQVVQLYAAAATIGGGTFRFAAGRSANDLTSWTSVTPSTVSPPAGGDSLATVTIAVPAGVSPGERYAVVWAQLAAATPVAHGVGSVAGVTTVNRVGVRIYLSVGEGSAPASSFVITTVDAQRDAQGDPEVSANVHNTGGRALDLSGNLSLAHGPGGLSAGPFAATLGTTLGIGQTEPVLFVLNRAIPDGPWDANVALVSGLTDGAATATITFPATASSSSAPVKAHTHSSGRSHLVFGLLDLAALIGISVVILLLLRRRRRRQSDEPSPSVQPSRARVPVGGAPRQR